MNEYNKKNKIIEGVGIFFSVVAMCLIVYLIYDEIVANNKNNSSKVNNDNIVEKDNFTDDEDTIEEETDPFEDNEIEKNTGHRLEITFDTDGGNVIPKYIVYSGEKIERPIDPTKKGYIFDGWEYEGEKFDFNTPASVYMTIYAQWKLAKKMSYDELKQMLKEELDKKDYSSLVKGFIYEIFDGLYNNYPTYYKVNKDLPPVDEYITKNLIDSIRRIEQINAYATGTKEAKELNEIGAGTWRNGIISFIYTPQLEVSNKTHQNELEALFHEIIHSRQKIQYDSFDIQMYNEAGATYNMKFATKYGNYHQIRIVNCNNGDDACKSKDSLRSAYVNDHGGGYSYIPYYYGYAKLVYILGYNTMWKFDNGQISLETLQKMIKDKTGYDLVSKYRELLEDRYYYSKHINYDQKINLEKIFLGILKKDIESISSSNTTLLRKYIDIYRNYKLKMLPKSYKYIQLTEKSFNDGEGIESDLTYQVYNLLELDGILANKIANTNILPKFSNNAKLNKMAIIALLTSNDYNYKGANKLYPIALPAIIENCKYYYYEENNNGHLILYYISNNVGKYYKDGIYFEFVFDESKIISANGINCTVGLDKFKAIF